MDPDRICNCIRVIYYFVSQYLALGFVNKDIHK